MIIGYDFDGVGYVFGNSVRNYLNTIGIGVPPATDEFCKSWDFYEFWGMTREEFDKHCDDGVDAGYVFAPGRGLTRPNFFESIMRVKSMGHTVIGITHRWQGSPGMAERNTMQWIGRYKNFFDDIVFSADKTSVKTDMFVEDNMGNYDKLVAAGTDAYLINRPWNAPYEDDRKRIGDISDFTAAVAARTESLTVV